MAKYINADEFTHRLIGICGCSDEVDTYRVFDLLQDMPAADAVEVVRCKDCVSKDKAKINNRGFLICPDSGMEICDTDYCSYAERKEAEE